MKTIIIILAALSILICGTGSASGSSGENHSTDTLDEILDGFDDASDSDEASNDLDSVLEGFDDSSDIADPDEDLGSILDGFDENDWVSGEEKTEVGTEDDAKYYELTGSISLAASYAYAHKEPITGHADYRGLSRLRPDLHLELDLKLSEEWKVLISGRAFYDLAYRINGRDQYTLETLNEYEKEIELQETYIHGSLLDNLDIKAGRQVVVWGKSDNIRVTDILNPLDMREPGIVDIEDLRLPILMTRLDYYKGPWNLTGIAIHEIRFNKTPVPGSEFYPPGVISLPESEPSKGFDNMEYAFALNGIFSGWDLSFYYAKVFNDETHIEMVAPLVLEQRHSRISMLGGAANIALGNWLIKSEAAKLDGLKLFNIPDSKKSRLDLLLGIEYSGFKDTMISFEAVNRHLFEFDQVLELAPDYVSEDELQTVFRYNGDFYHDRVHIVAILSTFGLTGDDGRFQRFSTEYDYNDNISITCGVVFYQSGDEGRYSNIGDKDRLFFEMKYSF